MAEREDNLSFVPTMANCIADLVKILPLLHADMKGGLVLLLVIVAFAHGPAKVCATYGWAQARTSLGRSLGEVIFEQPSSQGQQHKVNLRDGPSGTPASKVRLWLDQDCGFTALLSGNQVFNKLGPVNGDFTVNFDEMILVCTEGELNICSQTMLNI